MSGSMRWFSYLTDSGALKAVFADESNTELVNTVASTSLSPAGLEPLPKGFVARSVTLQSRDGNIKRKCVVLTQAALNAVSVNIDYNLTSATFSGVSVDTVVSPIYTTAEKYRRRPKIADTGLTDGDNP